MKTLIFTISLIASTSSFAGIFLKCLPVTETDNTGATLVIYGGQSFECIDKKENTFYVEFEGVGAGLEVTGDSLAYISCPLVNKKKILEGRPLKVFGPRISAGIIGGAQISAGLNQRAAFCTITGLNVTIGALVLIGKLTISHDP